MGGKSKDPNKAAMRAQREQMARLDKISLPELEEYLLQNPELVGLLEAEGIEDTKLAEIALDPKLRENQMKALESLAQRSEEGLTSEDKYMMEQMLGDVSAQEKSAREAIEADMARRGMESSGVAERARREAGQSAANQAREKAMQMAMQGRQQRMAALQALGQQSGQMESQDFSRQAQVGSAQDAIARANAMNRQNVSAQNLAARQSIENQRASIANQQAQVANQIAQQNFTNEIAKATGQGNVANSMSNIAANTPAKPSAFQSALGGASTGAAIGGMMTGATKGSTMGPWGAAIGAGAGLLASGMEDGGIAYADGGVMKRYEGGVPVDMKALEAEQKQKAKFKKDYMKQIHNELLEGGVPKKPQAADGGVMRYEDPYMSVMSDSQRQAIQNMSMPTIPMSSEPMASYEPSEADKAAEFMSNLGKNQSMMEADQISSQKELNKPRLTQEQIDDQKYGAGVVGPGKKFKTEKEFSEYRKKKEQEKLDKDKKKSDAISKGLGALSKMLGPQEDTRKKLELGEFRMDAPQNVMGMAAPIQFDNPFAQRAMDGAVMEAVTDPSELPERGGTDFASPDDRKSAIYAALLAEMANMDPEQQIPLRREDGGPVYASDGYGDVIDSGEESYAGDRVDAKVNDGEMILNLPQQQRLLDLIRGEIGVDELGSDDIIEGVPRDYRDDLHEEKEMESDDKMAALMKVIEMMGDK